MFCISNSKAKNTNKCIFGDFFTKLNYRNRMWSDPGVFRGSDPDPGFSWRSDPDPVFFFKVNRDPLPMPWFILMVNQLFWLWQKRKNIRSKLGRIRLFSLSKVGSGSGSGPLGSTTLFIFTIIWGIRFQSHSISSASHVSGITVNLSRKLPKIHFSYITLSLQSVKDVFKNNL